MSKDLLSGEFVFIRDADRHTNYLRYGRRKLPDDFARVQIGEYAGPGYYLELNYTQPCPRGCCRDSVRELIPAIEVCDLISDQMRQLAGFLKEARFRRHVTESSTCIDPMCPA